MKDIFHELAESEDEQIRKEIKQHFLHLHDSFPDKARWLAWLEKQGSKPQGKSALEAINEEKIDNANKVEPKFKIGDWVVFIATESLYQVEKIENHEYTLRHILGGSLCLSFSNEERIRKWTIQDAMGGDVLVDVYGNIGIFEKRYGINCHTYCYLGYKGRFIAEEGSHGSICCPATKEQRDLLFQKMKESGYEWNAEKKELKKMYLKGDKLSKL